MKVLKIYIKSSIILLITLCTSVGFSQVDRVTSPNSRVSQQVYDGSTSQDIFKGVALLIGNDAYSSPNKLKTPVHDVNLIRQSLIDLGYTVIISKNDDRSTMIRFMNDFINKSKKADLTFFYYAGHTVQANEKNYLVPIEAKLLDETLIPDESIDLDWFIQSLDTTKQNVISIDGCFPKRFPFYVSVDIKKSCFAIPKKVPSKTFISFTSLQYELLSTTSRRNSSFSHTFSKELKTGRNIYDVFYNTKASIKRETRGRQDITTFGNASYIRWKDGKFSKITAMQGSFPWPPPKASTTVTPEILTPLFKDFNTLGGVNSHLISALRNLDYSDKSYFSISDGTTNHGFAIATKLEQINEDRSSKKSEEGRWDERLLNDTKFSFGGYISSLFFPRKGYFRVIVFVITDINYVQSDATVGRDQAISWVQTGHQELDSKIATKSSQNYRVSALIYEYKLSENDVRAKLNKSSGYTGPDHLKKSQIWRELTQHK